MAIGQLIDGEQSSERCPSYDSFSLCKITKRKALLQAFTHPNYLIDFAFPMLYLRIRNEESMVNVSVIVKVGKYSLLFFPLVAYQIQNKRRWRHRNFAEEMSANALGVLRLRNSEYHLIFSLPRHR